MQSKQAHMVIDTHLSLLRCFSAEAEALAAGPLRQ
jgi:hypothetical protein